MEILYMLEKIRTPFLDHFMLLVTRFGEETAFLVAALIVFWCVDKRRGYYLMMVGFAGTMLNQFLKLLFRIPRPWVLDENFTIAEEAREAATGYSFPSGHSQSAVGTFGSLAVTERKIWLKGLFITIAVLVPFSRMYLGVHTPADVLAGSVISLLLVFLLRPVSGKISNRAMSGILCGMFIMAIGLLFFVSFWPFPADVDPHNLESGMKNAYTMLGCITAVPCVYYLEKRYVNFEPKASGKAQLVKILLGLALVLLVKEGLRGPLEALLPVYPARAVRYFLIVMTAGLIWPMAFRKIGEKL